jgi:hypothetical protein
VIYLATASGPAVRAAIAAGHLGQLVTPNTGNRVVPGARLAIDNGCYGGRWDMDRWSHTLDRHMHSATLDAPMHQPGCLWAVVPDVVDDAGATNRLWARWWSAPMRRGYRAAYVAQPGVSYIPAGAKAVFLGGSYPAWKYGPEARAVARFAKDRGGFWLHMGRVNSLRRLRYAQAIGCDSVDGTYLTYAPDTNLPRLLRFLRQASEPTLFTALD